MTLTVTSSLLLLVALQRVTSAQTRLHNCCSLAWLGPEMASIAPANLSIFPIPAADGALPDATGNITAVGCRRLATILWERLANTVDNGLCPEACAELVTEGLRVFNALASFRTRSGLSFEPLPSQTTSSIGETVRFEVRSRFLGSVGALDRPREDQPAFGEALPELLQSNDTVRATDLTTVRPYNPDFVNVVKAGHHAVDLEPLLPEAARRLLMKTGRIIRDDSELKEDLLSAPLYTDPALRRYDVLLDRALSLHKRAYWFSDSADRAKWASSR